MKHTPFVLNNRFLVNPAIGNLSDQKTGREARLEPRLMNVLCVLAENAGQLVSREQLIKVVWNNYGGADEGLSQAVSFLRKLLDDPGKKIIETIPTKGYLLNATLMDETKVQPEKRGKIFWIAALGLAVGIAAVSYCFWPSGGTLPVLSVKPMPNIKTEVIKPLPDLRTRDTLRTHAYH